MSGDMSSQLESVYTPFRLSLLSRYLTREPGKMATVITINRRNEKTNIGDRICIQAMIKQPLSKISIPINCQSLSGLDRKKEMFGVFLSCWNT